MPLFSDWMFYMRRSDFYRKKERTPEFVGTDKFICSRKDAYESERIALKKAEELQNLYNNEDGITLRVYKCKVCKKFHLTKSRKI